MNYRMITYVLGLVLNFEACFMLLPLATGAIYGEPELVSFAISALICLAVGFLLRLKKPATKSLYAADGLVVVALSWIVLSLFGAVPFVISGSIPNFIDALFETVSGFTTTGASILSDVEHLPRCILMWRSFTHWIGGMGVIVFMMAILPLSGGRNIHLMRAESPGPVVGKLVPHVRKTARILYLMYMLLTVLQIILLLAGRMPLFDALTTAFGTAGTGGFGIKNSSIGQYSPYLQTVTAVFMVLFGVNFNVYYYLYARRAREAFKHTETRVYLGIIIVSTAIIAYNVSGMYKTVGETVRTAFFQVASVITTTGFSTVDFDMWPALSKTILVVLMFIGACAGSTGGGLKVSRVMIAMKTIRNGIVTSIHPKSVSKLKIGGHTVEPEVLKSTNVYFMAYIAIFALSLLIISVDNFSTTTNFTAVASTINNIGPGLEAVGPASNFGAFSNVSKIVFILDMLIGRLEIFPMLALVYPGTWKK